ncbi:MAG: hypothetical protein AB7Y46_19035 [Armatimonadota bacterium]
MGRTRRIELTGPTASRGTVLPTALAFGATAVLLSSIAMHALFVGRHAGSPRRTALAIVLLAVAALVVTVSMAVAMRAVMRRRRLAELLRPGELLIGTFDADLLEHDAEPRRARGVPVRLSVTNQRLLVHRPGAHAPWLDLEHEQVASVRDLGPTLLGRIRRCLLQRVELSDGRVLVMRMNAAAAVDFAPVRGQYLEPKPRQMRAVVVAAEGPTPARPQQPLSTVMVERRPTVCLLELDENYLRIISEHTPPLADLYYYFHWEHMRVEGPSSAQVPRLPDSWLCVRLVFHEDSTLTLCGTPAALTRLREHALAAGAAGVPG